MLLRSNQITTNGIDSTLIGRLFAQDAELYADIIMDKPENLAVIGNTKQTYEELYLSLKNNDRQGFIDAFQKVHD